MLGSLKSITVTESKRLWSMRDSHARTETALLQQAVAHIATMTLSTPLTQYPPNQLSNN